MKNIIYDRDPNGKLFCWHDWVVIEHVGVDWDIYSGLKILCKCNKCGKLKRRSNYLIEEVPDSLINPSIFYF